MRNHDKCVQCGDSGLNFQLSSVPQLCLKCYTRWEKIKITMDEIKEVTFIDKDTGEAVLTFNPHEKHKLEE